MFLRNSTVLENIKYHEAVMRFVVSSLNERLIAALINFVKKSLNSQSELSTMTNRLRSNIHKHNSYSLTLSSV